MTIIAEPMTRASKNGGTIPVRFQPRFWADADRRVALIRAIEGRVERLKLECGADSYAKQTLAERAIFLITCLETNELNALDGTKALDPGVHTQMLNSLCGILKVLGIDKQAKRVGLKEYLDGKIE
jgi:hypothetical protein